jgi:hypothetical protein
VWGLHAPLPATHDHYGICLVLAFFYAPELDGLYALMIDDEGLLRTSPVSNLRTEWRFNWTTHKWEDMDVEEFFDAQGDGGEEVSGDLSDAN